jgi:hypothetical protein
VLDNQNFTVPIIILDGRQEMKDPELSGNKQTNSVAFSPQANYTD